MVPRFYLESTQQCTNAQEKVEKRGPVRIDVTPTPRQALERPTATAWLRKQGHPQVPAQQLKEPWLWNAADLIGCHP